MKDRKNKTSPSAESARVTSSPLSKDSSVKGISRDDYLATSAATDCTGLIPAAPANDAEVENYEELYPFLPQPVVRKKD